MATAIVLLAVATASLCLVCLNLTRRIRSIENFFYEAAERLGEPQYE